MHGDHYWDATDGSRGHGHSDSRGGNSSSGRKGRLDHNVLAYYRETLRHLDEMRCLEWGNHPDYEQLLTTAFDSLAREGRQLAQNQTGSRLVESLIALADWPRLALLVTNLAGNWPVVIGDRFAHRVLQAAIRRYLTLRLEGNGEADVQSQQCEADDDGDTPADCDPRRLWGDFAVHMRLHYPEYLEHPYACHALRSYLLLLAGVLVKPGAPGTATGHAAPVAHDSYDPSCAVLVDPPLELEGVPLAEELEGLASRFLENKHVMSLIDSEVTGPFLQVLMLVLRLRLPKRFRKFFKHLRKQSGLLDATCEIEAIGQKYTVPSLLCSSRGSYFLEQLVSLLSPKQLRRFVSAYIAGKEAALALHANANFVLQRLVKGDPPPGEFLSAFVGSAVGEEPEGWLAEALRLPPGRQQQLLVLLARQCRSAQPLPPDEARRLQGLLMRRLAAMAAASSVPSMFEFIAGMGVAGSQLLEELFQFAEPKRLCSSLLACEPQRLADLCRCRHGNRVIEACLASGSVPADTKLALCDRLLASVADLCCDKHGSRVADALWAVGDRRLRERVASQLASGGRAGLERLRFDRFGRFACQKFAPELLASRPGDWRRLQQQLDEARQQRSRPNTAEASAGQPQAKRRKGRKPTDK